MLLNCLCPTVPELSNLPSGIEDRRRIASDWVTVMTEREGELISTVRLEVVAGIAGDLPGHRELRISEESFTKCEQLQSWLVELSKEINW
jgi:hypothetical protein